MHTSCKNRITNEPQGNCSVRLIYREHPSVSLPSLFTSFPPLAPVNPLCFPFASRATTSQSPSQASRWEAASARYKAVTQVWVHLFVSGQPHTEQANRDANPENTLNESCQTNPMARERGRRALRGTCWGKDSAKVKANVRARKRRREGEGNTTEKHQNHPLSFTPLLRAGSATQLLKCATKWASSSSQLLPLHPSTPPTPAISLQQSLWVRTLWGGPADALPGFHSGRVEDSFPRRFLPTISWIAFQPPHPSFTFHPLPD